MLSRPALLVCLLAPLLTSGCTVEMWVTYTDSLVADPPPPDPPVSVARAARCADGLHAIEVVRASGAKAHYTFLPVPGRWAIPSAEPAPAMPAGWAEVDPTSFHLDGNGLVELRVAPGEPHQVVSWIFDRRMDAPRELELDPWDIPLAVVLVAATPATLLYDLLIWVPFHSLRDG